MTLTQVTTQDQHRWQLAAVDVLAELVREGHDTELPAIDWTIPTSATVHGQAHVADDHAREQAVRRWADHLGADIRTIEHAMETVTQAEATRTAPRSGARVTVHLTARTWREES